MPQIPPQSSLFLPRFLESLADPSIGTVMLCGCGGGFDFVHSLIVPPSELKDATGENSIP